MHQMHTSDYEALFDTRQYAFDASNMCVTKFDVWNVWRWLGGVGVSI